MPVAVSSQAQFTALVNADKLSVIDFTATWCGPCKTVAPRFDALAAKYPDANFLKVDVDENKDIAAAYQIKAMPTFILIKNGEKLDEVVGADIVKVEALVAKHAASSASFGGLASGLSAEEYKNLGNKAFSSGDFHHGIRCFTAGIAMDPTNHVLFSNRSACHASLKEWTAALDDAEETIKINSTWAKGYSRKGTALYGLSRFQEAVEAYQAGLKIDPNNVQLKKGLEDAEEALSGGMDDGNFAPGKLFSGDVFAKIAGNPKLAPYLAQPDFMQKVAAIQQNPKMLSQYMQDPRILTVMMSLMGLDATAMGRDEMNAKYDTEPAATPSPQPTAAPAAAASSATPVIDEDVVMDDEERERKEKRGKSDLAKEKGNKLYKARKFDEALEMYDEALKEDETNVAVLTNKAAVQFEMGDYEACIGTCNDAVERGRELRVDYKLIAKALARAGNALAKLDRTSDAIKHLQKSLAEHRDPTVLSRLRDLEKEEAKKAKEAYRNVALSDEARERGNVFFKAAQYVEAVKEYSEAVKRNDTDPRAYTNRAACYVKLMAIAEAERDCEKAIELDPNFVKGYIRKASVLVAKREWSKVMEVCEQARTLDTEGKHRAEIDSQLSKAFQGMNEVQTGANKEEIYKKAMEDPEVQRILSDPVMKQILQQMQEDPRAAQDHMKNPTVAANIRKLVDAGIIRTR